MVKLLKIVFLVIFFGSLVGCAAVSGGAVYSKVTRYNDFPLDKKNGSFVIVPLDYQKGSVEFRRYAKYIESKLIERGFTKEPDENLTEYAVIFEYGTSGQKQILSTKKTEEATEITSHTEFDRFLNFKIYDAQNSTKSHFIAIYEGTVKSSGSSENFSTVSYCLIDALFKDFYKNGTDNSDSSLTNKLSNNLFGGDNTKCVQ